MNPIITSLPGFSQSQGAQPKGGEVGDYPSFATVLPAYAAQGPGPGESGDGLTGEVTAISGQAQETVPFPSQQQPQLASTVSEEAADSDLETGLPYVSQPGPNAQGIAPDSGSGERQLSLAGILPQDGQQAVSAALTGAPSPEQPSPRTAQLQQLAPQVVASASEVMVAPTQQMNTSLVQGHLPASSVGSSMGESLGAWRPLTGNAVTQVSATELPPQLAEGERRTTDTAASVMTQISGGRSSQWGPLPLDASAGFQNLGRQMLAPLKEQVRFSLDHGITRAEVRLDPPDLGRIDLSVRHEGDRVTVQLTAANPAVREALALGAERLRSEMSQGLGAEVQVDVGQGAPQEKQQQPEYPGGSTPLMAALDPAMEQPATERDLIDMLA
ncbi:flagellar hook-length control protein FliK [Ferrimonas sp.]|uniref:flagellar hook-length control protein FliK n=1 Tax=Ferrimonas sp. TaxID=2080861 RepID=UPI003A8F2C6C